jgi:hypothetical protein|tara:strand:+ start:315 stop:605 length:291 start_codon:yes stop_codon:yes gene_type:complete
MGDMNLKNDTGTAVTLTTGPLQKSSYKECSELVAELAEEEASPERAELFLAQYLATDDSDLRQQLSGDLFREFEIVIEPIDQLTLPNNIPPQSDRI